MDNDIKYMKYLKYMDVETISPEKNKDDQPSPTSIKFTFDQHSFVSQPEPDMEYIDNKTISPEKNKDDQPSQSLMKINFDQPSSASQPYPDSQSHVFLQPYPIKRPHTVIRPQPIRLVPTFYRPPAIFPLLMVCPPVTICGLNGIHPPHAITKRRRVKRSRPPKAALQPSTSWSYSPPEDTVNPVYHFMPLHMHVLMHLLASGFFNCTDAESQWKFISGVYLLPGMYEPFFLPVAAYVQAFRNEMVKLDQNNKRRNK